MTRVSPTVGRCARVGAEARQGHRERNPDGPRGDDGSASGRDGHGRSGTGTGGAGTRVSDDTPGIAA